MLYDNQVGKLREKAKQLVQAHKMYGVNTLMWCLFNYVATAQFHGDDVELGKSFTEESLKATCFMEDRRAYHNDQLAIYWPHVGEVVVPASYIAPNHVIQFMRQATPLEGEENRPLVLTSPLVGKPYLSVSLGLLSEVGREQDREFKLALKALLHSMRINPQMLVMQVSKQKAIYKQIENLMWI